MSIRIGSTNSIGEGLHAYNNTMDTIRTIGVVIILIFFMVIFGIAFATGNINVTKPQYNNIKDYLNYNRRLDSVDGLVSLSVSEITTYNTSVPVALTRFGTQQSGTLTFMDPRTGRITVSGEALNVVFDTIQQSLTLSTGGKVVPLYRRIG